MTDLLTRLKDWETVYPCDMDKPDGNLYGEAYDALTKAITKLEEINAWVEAMLRLNGDYGHIVEPPFRNLPELLRELQE